MAAEKRPRSPATCRPCIDGMTVSLKCPTCRLPYPEGKLVRNRMLEAVTAKLRIPCKYGSGFIAAAAATMKRACASGWSFGFWAMLCWSTSFFQAPKAQFPIRWRVHCPPLSSSGITKMLRVRFLLLEPNTSFLRTNTGPLLKGLWLSDDTPKPNGRQKQRKSIVLTGFWGVIKVRHAPAPPSKQCIFVTRPVPLSKQCIFVTRELHKDFHIEGPKPGPPFRT